MYLFTSPFSPLHIFYIPLLAPTYLLHPPSHNALNQANLETLSQRRQSITTKLFDSIACNSDHKLYKLLPPQNNCVHFSYTFLILLLDFTIVTINLIQLLAVILIRINYLLLVTPRYLLHPPSHPSTSLTSLSSSINTHTNIFLEGFPLIAAWFAFLLQTIKTNTLGTLNMLGKVYDNQNHLQEYITTNVV